MSVANTLFTAGYEGRSMEDFLAGLREHGVQLLADLREAPVSRKPGFSKSPLAGALKAAGIDYVHLRALGCPKPIRDRYKQDGDWARYTRAFLEHLERQQGALEELGSLARNHVTALLCYEADYNRCHRTYVADAVAGRSGMNVVHITASDDNPTGALFPLLS